VLYRQWQKALEKPILRLPHKAGEGMQVDYAGQKMRINNPLTGETREVQIFVSALGASGYIYTEAHWRQSKQHWIGAHVRAFRYYSGVPEIIIPDNLKAGVKNPCYYDPDLNPTYHELAEHYATVVIPARVGHPKDKALVENAVLQVERWVLAPLRDRKFFGLNELNQAIREQLTILNNRKLTGEEVSRYEKYAQLDQPALRPLPEHPFEYTEVKYAKAHIDYHVVYNKHYYSVPYQYCGQRLLIRATEYLIEIFHDGQRIACHPRIDQPGYSTSKEHMPNNHRQFLEWSPDRFRNWAKEHGPSTEKLIGAVLSRRSHPQQAYRTCLGILSLAKKYSPEQLETACAQALTVGIYSYRGVKQVLLTKKDMLKSGSQLQAVSHEHVRGETYYT